MEVSILTITYVLAFSGLQAVRVWYANHTSYFGRLRYI